MFTQFAKRVNENAGIVTAAATVALAILTWLYINLNARYLTATQTMLHLQESPEIAAWLTPRMNSKSLLIKNFGAQPISDLQGMWTAYPHALHGSTVGEPMGEFGNFSIPATMPKRGWIMLQTLAPGKTYEMNLSATLGQIGQSVEVENKYDWKPPTWVHGPISIVHLVITLQYRRQVDGKLYRTQVEGAVLKAANLGQYTLRALPIVAPEPAFHPFGP